MLKDFSIETVVLFKVREKPILEGYDVEDQQNRANDDAQYSAYIVEGLYHGRELAWPSHDGVSYVIRNKSKGWSQFIYLWSGKLEPAIQEIYYLLLTCPQKCCDSQWKSFAVDGQTLSFGNLSIDQNIRIGSARVTKEIVLLILEIYRLRKEDIAYVFCTCYERQVSDWFYVPLRVKCYFFWVDLAVVLLKNSMAEDWSGWKVPEEVKAVFFERLNIVDSHHIVDLKAWDSCQDYSHKDSNHYNVFDSPHYFFFGFIYMFALLIERDLLLPTLFEPQYGFLSQLDIRHLPWYSFVRLLIAKIAEIKLKLCVVVNDLPYLLLVEVNNSLDAVFSLLKVLIHLVANVEHPKHENRDL